MGKRQDSKLWRVAVQHPREENKLLTVLEIEDRAIATSGDYQRFFEVNGNRFSHIINPLSGYPCDNVPASVTVIADSCLAADALATSIFVLGPKKGIELIENLPDTEALVISDKGNKLTTFASKGLLGIVEINNE